MRNYLADLGLISRELDELHAAALIGDEDSLDLARRAGCLLFTLKDGLKFDLLGDWVAEHCSFTERTARIYMRIAQQWDRIAAARQTSNSPLSICVALQILLCRSADFGKVERAWLTARPDERRKYMRFPGIAIPYVLLLDAGGWDADGIAETLLVNVEQVERILTPSLPAVADSELDHSASNEAWANGLLAHVFARDDGFLDRAIQLTRIERMEKFLPYLASDRRQWKQRWSELGDEFADAEGHRSEAGAHRAPHLAAFDSVSEAIGLTPHEYEQHGITIFDVWELLAVSDFIQSLPRPALSATETKIPAGVEPAEIGLQPIAHPSGARIDGRTPAEEEGSLPRGMNRDRCLGI